ncbi:MAG: hypothetical protein K8R59_01755 [Thermoanaerobaculales bacterium]|nr:hypothetical protein [Thermoanaerobaculales bacterium]
MNGSKVKVRYNGIDHIVEDGTRIDEFLSRVDQEMPENVLSALVNRRQVMLDFPLRGVVELDLVRYGDREGESVYKRSVCMMFHEACWELFPDVELVVGQSLGNCYHYQVRGDYPALGRMAKELERRMVEIRDEGRIFERRTVTLEELENHFRREGREDKLELLATRRSSTVHTVSCGGFVDIAHGPYVPTTGCLPSFGVQSYGDGLVLRFPRRSDRAHLPQFMPRELLFHTSMETRHWQELLGVSRVGQLNRICLAGDVRHLVRVAEGLHEKKISCIADEILSRLPEVRLVTIAGPSSSGKTTFSKRLGIQLRVNAIEPVALSLDNYYVNRTETPLDEDGEPNFESIDAIDLPLFHQHLAALLEGEEVRTPRFDFLTGLRAPERDWVPMRLDEGQVLVIEGIHGLNPRMTASVPKQRIFRIYVSALSQLAIDDHNRIFTSDTRLIRRIVRDRMFRGFDAERTLEMWERVRRGEGKWIFPFQDQADIMFDSALVYEPAVLKIFAERFLLQVPRSSPTYTEAYRLLKGMSMFVPVFPDEVPHTSLLREFIGGSTFRE